jgi:DNA-binding transcriptional LysR family regulator
MSYQLEFRHLKYFIGLVEEMHFRKAAEKLFISQPALSKQIKNLEAELGIILIERDKKKFKLSEAGKYFYEEAKYTLNHLDQVITHSREIAQGNQGTIRIGFVGSAMQDILPKALLSLADQYPGILTSLEELSNQEQIDRLVHDQLDIGFIRQRSVPPLINVIPVHIDTFSIVIPHTKDHFLDFNVENLKEEPFILFSPQYSSEYYNTVISICRDYGFEPNITHKTVHANTIYRLVENGMGVSIVPTALTSGFDLKISFRELKHIPQRTTLYMATKSKNRNPSISHLIDIISPK